LGCGRHFIVVVVETERDAVWGGEKGSGCGSYPFGSYWHGSLELSRPAMLR
jgi:hypothetical protein